MAGGAAPRRLREAAAAAALTSGARTTFRASLARLLPAAELGSGPGAAGVDVDSARAGRRHGRAAAALPAAPGRDRRGQAEYEPLLFAGHSGIGRIA